MKSLKLNNERLLELIKSDIKEDFEIALHNISLKSYFEKIEEQEDVFNEKYKINTSNISSLDIASNILQKGLAVPYNTLRCTTTFIGDKTSVKKEDFNYLYRIEDIDVSKIYTILVTIPSFITLEDKEYFIGKITKKSSGLIEPTVSTDLFFRKHLPPEFIYEYYVKESFGYVIENDLEFVMNDHHISKMNKVERCTLYKDILKQEKIPMALLDAILKEDKKYQGNTIQTDLCVKNAIVEKQKLMK